LLKTHAPPVDPAVQRRRVDEQLSQGISAAGAFDVPEPPEEQGEIHALVRHRLQEIAGQFHIAVLGRGKSELAA
jgi:hypothetical protein